MVESVWKCLSGFLSRLQSGQGTRRRKRISCNVSEAMEPRMLLAASGIQAFHRSGQTFITWNEDNAVTGERYHVYRSSSPITTSTLSGAQLLTSRWGPLDEHTSVNINAAPDTEVPAHFVIRDSEPPLSPDTGLFVYTTPVGESGSWYYAVTQVVGTSEQRALTAGSNSLSVPVLESVAPPAPVLTVSHASGKAFIYTQYMDYAGWNPTFQGYAFNYSVALPENYTPTVSWPVKVMTHAYGERFRMEPSAEYGWPCIQIFVDDPGGGASGTMTQTWWYGFAADHNYQTNGPVPSGGVIENFTEQRVLKTLDEVAATFSVDTRRIHVQGHSMGASGALALGMRYGNVLAGIFASEPMTNYAGSPNFQEDFQMLWGTQQSNLPVVNKGPYAAHLQRYDNVGVYDWMNHQKQLRARRGDSMAFLMVGHGKVDDIIDWATQGRPFIAALNAANAGFTAEMRGGWDHTWMGFSYAHEKMLSPGDGSLSSWIYPRDMSFPGITAATGSGAAVPAAGGTDIYNLSLEWAVPWNPFHRTIVDTPTRYEISLRSVSGRQTATITPQKTQEFRPPRGTTIEWRNIDNTTGTVIQSGIVTADNRGLVTVPQFDIGTGRGNRLILVVRLTAPTIFSPAGTVNNSRPSVRWSSDPYADSYEVVIRDLTTPERAVIRTITRDPFYQHAEAMGIGSYNVSVRAKNSTGLAGPWSEVRRFRINAAPRVGNLSNVSSTQPTISWTPVPGAVSYSIRINNMLTGQAGVVSVDNLTTTQYQLPGTPELGAFSVLVRAVDAAGLPTAWSAPRPMRLRPQVEAIAPRNSSFSLRPIFQWSELNGAATYELTVRQGPNGTVVSRQTGLTGNSWTPATDFAAGDYRWSIRGIHASSMLGAWTSPITFTTGGKPNFSAMPTSTNSRRPEILWDAVGGAAKYELRIVSSGGTEAVRVTDILTTSYTPVTPLAPGTYRLWVRAVNAEGGFSDWRSNAQITIL